MGRWLDVGVPLVCVTAAAALSPAGNIVWPALAGLAGAAGRLLWREPPIDEARETQRADQPRSVARSFPLLEDLPIALILIGSTGTVEVVSGACRTLLERDIVGLPIAVVFRAPSILSAVEAAVERGEGDRFEFRVRRPREMILTATVQPIDDGDVRRVALILTDSTGLKRVSDARSDFVSNASHELRTPLAAISGLVETLQGPARDDPEARERFLAVIAKQTERMTRLTNDLLSLSRIELEENIAPTTVLDLSDVVADAMATIQPLAMASDAVIRQEIDRPMPQILGSRDELAQVLVNLLENAIKYGGAGVLVTLSAQRDGDRLKLMVSDNGPGVAAEHIPRLTERFFRVDAANSRTRGGTGLGLAIVKHIVSRHRGALEIESIPDEGSEFSIFLPIHDPRGGGSS